MPRSVVLVALLTVALATAGCQRGQPEASAGEDTPAVAQSESATTVGSFTFTAADAAALFGVPESAVEAEVSELYPGSTMYSFTTADGAHRLAFNASIAESVEEAERSMAQYRSHLGTAAQTAPFAGSESGEVRVGDEAVWTEVNDTLTVRKGAVTFQIQEPADKAEQIKAAEALVGKV
jgi:hypothetical protein